MNATTACDASPNTFLFSGGCCASNSEPADLAKWIETLCNQTWRVQFEDFDRMAQRDWAEWILPWNWTVRSDHTVQPTCSPIPRYLGLFVAENAVFLFFAILYGAATLWLLREKQAPQPHPVAKAVWIILKPFKSMTKGGKWLIGLLYKSKNSGGGTGTVVVAVLLALALTSFQLAANFATAFIIKNTPGYQHVPAPMLALLFCCRPRLGWLACILALFKDEWLVKVFRLSPDNPKSYQKARGVVARTSLGSGLSEVVMQCLGAYFMGKTTDVGVKRGFYSDNGGHLKPFWRGGHARLMYVGSLFWLVAGAGIILSWLVVVYFAVKLVHAWESSLSWWNEAAKATAKTIIPQRFQTSQMKNWSNTNEAPPVHRKDSASQSEESENMIGDGFVQRRYHDNLYDPDSGLQNIRGGAGSRSTPSGLSSSTAYDALPMRPGDFPTMSSSSGESPRLQRNGYEQVSTDPEMLQMRPADFPIPTTVPGPGGSARYQPVQQDPEMLQMRPADFTIPTIPPPNSRSAYHDDRLRRRSPTRRTQDGREDEIFVARADPRPQFEPYTGYDSGQYHNESHEERTPSPQFDPNDEPPFRKWQVAVIGIAVTFGFISYIAQWFFWAGFVYTSGEKLVSSITSSLVQELNENRFCPPDLAKVGTLWSIASILGTFLLERAFGRD